MIEAHICSPNSLETNSHQSIAGFFRHGNESPRLLELDIKAGLSSWPCL